MKCPKCNNFIWPFKVWFITRWTFIKCEKCGTEYGRNIDLQLWVIGILLLIPMLILRVHLFSPFFLFWALVVMFINSWTIKLIPKDEIKREEISKKRGAQAILLGIGIALTIIIIVAILLFRGI